MVKAVNLKFDFPLFLVKRDLEILFIDVDDREKGFPDWRHVDLAELP